MNRPLRSKKLWGGKMKLESFSKEELISWLRTHSFNGASEDKIISDLLYERTNKLQEKVYETEQKFLKVCEEYYKLLEPYQGKLISELPDEIIYRGAELEREKKRLKTIIDKNQKEYDKNLEEYSKRTEF